MIWGFRLFGTKSLQLALKVVRSVRFGAVSAKLHLDFQNNKLASIPDGVCCAGSNSDAGCAGIYVMDLGTNALTAIPRTITNLASTLAVLDLRNNRLESLPGNLATLDHLTFLSVRNNRLKVRPWCSGILFQLGALVSSVWAACLLFLLCRAMMCAVLTVPQSCCKWHTSWHSLAANGVSSTAANGVSSTAANGVSSTAANGVSSTAALALPHCTSSPPS